MRYVHTYDIPMPERFTLEKCETERGNQRQSEKEWFKEHLGMFPAPKAVIPGTQNAKRTKSNSNAVRFDIALTPITSLL